MVKQGNEAGPTRTLGDGMAPRRVRRRREGALASSVVATISSRPRMPKAWARTAVAASVARPWDQWVGARL
jgi:hypothetical protein